MKIYKTLLAIGIMASIPTTALALNFDKVKIGDKVCYDRLGTVDSTATVVSINHGAKTVKLLLENNAEKTVKFKKVHTRAYCLAKQQAQEAVVEKSLSALDKWKSKD